MTDISPEAVERMASTLDEQFRKMCGVHSREAETLRAQAARIAELEADLNTLRSHMPNRRAYNVGQAIGRASRQVEVDRLTTEAQAARAEALREGFIAGAHAVHAEYSEKDADFSEAAGDYATALIEKEG